MDRSAEKFKISANVKINMSHVTETKLSTQVAAKGVVLVYEMKN